MDTHRIAATQEGACRDLVDVKVITSLNKMSEARIKDDHTFIAGLGSDHVKSKLTDAGKDGDFANQTTLETRR
jgi:hypothetical protein